MTHNDSLRRLQDWYRSHCDGDWEHDSRIQIGTIDNPGWSLRVNLEDTFAHPLEMDRFQVERTPDDWCSCWLEGQAFNGAGGPVNLKELISRFLDWITRYEEAAVPREDRNGVEAVSALEQEWDLDSGSLGALRLGNVDEQRLRRLEQLLKKLPTKADMLEARLVALTWYIPIFMSWQKERCVAEGYEPTRFDQAVNRITSLVEEALGVP